MSSRRASTNAFQDELRQSRIDFRLDPDRNQVAPSEASAFYRILLGHQDEVAVRKLQLLRPERVVVGERVRREHEAHARERGEKSPGIADTRDSVKPLARQLR